MQDLLKANKRRMKILATQIKIIQLNTPEPGSRNKNNITTVYIIYVLESTTTPRPMPGETTKDTEGANNIISISCP